MRETVYLLFLANICITTENTATDLHKYKESFWENVVDSSIEKISQYLNHTHSFPLLKRIALVESNFGENVEIVNGNPKGGIWQISSHITKELVANSHKSNASHLIKIIENHCPFCIGCFLCDDDFSTPIRSALAALVYIEHNTRSTILGDLPAQASWWAKFYHPGQDKKTFVKAVLKFENRQNCEVDRKMNLWFLLDAPELTADHQLRSNLNAVASLVSRFNVSPAAVRVGLSVCCTVHDVIIPLEKSSSFAAFKKMTSSWLSSIKAAQWKDFGTVVENIMKESTTDEDSTIQNGLAFLIVSNKPSTDDQIILELRKMVDAGMLVFVVQIGEKEENIKEDKTLSLFGDHYIIKLHSCKDLIKVSTQDSIINKILPNPKNNHDTTNQKMKKNYSGEFLSVCCNFVCSDGGLWRNNQHFNDTNITRLSETIQNTINFNCSQCSQNASKSLSPTNQTKGFQNTTRSSELDVAYEELARLLETIQNETNSQADTENKLQKKDIKERTMDLWFMVDSSLILEEDNLRHVTNFTSQFSKKLSNVSSTIKFLIFKEGKTFDFSYNGLSDPAIQQHVASMTQQNENFESLKKAIDEVYESEFRFKPENEAGLDSTDQFLFVLSSRKKLEKFPSVRRHHPGGNISVYVIGIESNSNETNLNATNIEGTSFYHLADPAHLSTLLNRDIFSQVCPIDDVVEKKNDQTKHSTPQPEDSPNQGADSNNLLPHIEATEVSRQHTQFVAEEATTSRPNNPSSIETTTSKKNLSTGLAGRDLIVQKKISKDEEISWLLYAVLGGTVVIMCLAFFVAACCSSTRRVGSAKDDVEEGCLNKRDREIRTTTEQLEKVSLEANKPEAGTSIMKQLKKLLILSEKLGIHSGQLDDSYNVLKNLTTRFQTFVDELTVITDDAKSTTADQSTLVILGEKLSQAEKLQLPANKLSDASETMKSLEARLAMLKDLNKLISEAEKPNTSPACKQDLQVQIALAESQNFPPELLVGAKTTLKEVEDRIQILDDLTQVTKEANDDNSSLSTLQKLEQTILSAERVKISVENLKESQIAKENLSKRIHEKNQKCETVEKLLRELPGVTDMAMMTTATVTCLCKLEDVLSDAELMEISEEKLKKTKLVRDDLKKRIDTVKEDLQQATEEAKTSTVSMYCFGRLKDQLRLAVSLEVSEESLKEPYCVLDMMKKRMDALKLVQELSKEVQESTATQQSSQELHKQLELAETLFVPAEDLSKPRDLLEKLDLRLKATEELKAATKEAQQPSATAFAREKLKEIIAFAEQAKVTPNHMKESCDVLDILTKRLEKEADMADSIEKALQELRGATYEAKLPTATIQCAGKLQTVLRIAEALEIPHDKIKDSYEALNELNQRIDQAVEDLSEAIEEANSPTVTVTCKKRLKDSIRVAESLEISRAQLQVAHEALERVKKRTGALKELTEATVEAQESKANEFCLQRLGEKLAMAERLNIPAHQMKESYQVQESLQMLIDEETDKKKRTEDTILELASLTAEARIPNATVDCMARLRSLLDVADKLGIPRARLKDAAEALKELNQRIDAISENVVVFANEVKQSHATIAAMEKLEKQLHLASSAKIPEDQMEESFCVLENMKSRVNEVILNLQRSTDNAKSRMATVDAASNLQEHIKAAESLQIPQDQLKAPRDALETLNNRIKVLLEDVKSFTREAKLPTATIFLMEMLQEKLIAAKNLRIPQEQLKEAEQAFEDLKCRVNYFLSDLKAVTDEAKDPYATLACVEKLERKVSQAEDLQIPQEQLKESYSALEILKGRGDEVMNDLIVTTCDAKAPTSTMTSIKKLEEKLKVAEKLHVPKEKLFDARNTLEMLKSRVDKVRKELKAATAAANDEVATYNKMKELERVLESAQEIQVPHDEVKQAYYVLEKLKARIDTVCKDIQSIVEKTMTATAIVPCSAKLQEHIDLARKLEVPSNLYANATALVKTLTDRVEEILGELKTVSQEVNSDNITTNTMETLEEKLSIAESFQIPSDRLKEAHDALQNLKDRVSIVSVDLMNLTSRSNERGCTYKHYHELKEKLALAEKLHTPSIQLNSSYKALQAMKDRVDIIMNELVTCSNEAKSNATFAAMVKLQEQMIFAADFEIPQSQMQGPYDVLKKLKNRVNEVMHDLKIAVEDSLGPASSKAEIAKLEWQIPIAECLAIPSLQLNAAYDALEELKNRKIEVSSIKEKLKQGLASNNLDRLNSALKRADAISYLMTWDPEDMEVFELVKRCKEAEKQMMKAAKCSAEEVAQRNRLREELTLALEKDFDRKTLQRVTIDFKNSLGANAPENDKDLLMTARDTYIKKSKDWLISLLTSALKSRKSHNVHNALAEVNMALQVEDLTYLSIDSSPVLKAAIQRGRDMMGFFSELEGLKRSVMALKQSITEMRSYQNPPQAIKKVMEATFVLLGEDKKKMKEWIEIQSLLSKMGKESLKRAIVERDISQITKRDADKAALLVSNLRAADLVDTNKAASVFLAWTNCITQEIQCCEVWK